MLNEQRRRPFLPQREPCRMTRSVCVQVKVLLKRAIGFDPCNPSYTQGRTKREVAGHNELFAVRQRRDVPGSLEQRAVFEAM